jgi:uncharacterized protein
MRARWRLIERATGLAVVERLAIADRFWSRFVGWQLRAAPPAGSGLLLAPCPSIHTCGMRFAIDAAFLDRAGRVVEVRRGVPPWRVVIPAQRTFAVLEVPARDGVPIVVGATLRLEAPSAGRQGLSRRLASWVEGLL